MVEQIKLDPVAAKTALIRFRDQLENHYAAHMGDTPEFIASAAGNGFAEYGAALSNMFCALHTGFAERTRTLIATMRSAKEQVGEFETTEGDFSEKLRGSI